jgi:hypothetical protein
MFTYKFLGLSKEDAPTPYYYGSLPVKPEIGHTLSYDDTGNRYSIVHIEGEGLEGDNGYANEKELAWADIARGEAVPTLWVKKLGKKELAKLRVRQLRKKEPAQKDIKPRGRSFTCDEVKEFSQKNRKTRLAKPSKKKDKRKT